MIRQRALQHRLSSRETRRQRVDRGPKGVRLKLSPLRDRAEHKIGQIENFRIVSGRFRNAQRLAFRKDVDRLRRSSIFPPSANHFSNPTRNGSDRLGLARTSGCFRYRSVK
jgi:hypothetical protein